MPVSLYMAMCLHDSVDGYYATRPGLGRDFVTAPEVSQVFGELLGAWAAHEWVAMGKPASFQLVELGPGRGVMIVDVLRAAGREKGFLDAANIVLLEVSPVLRRAQLDRLPGRKVLHVSDLKEIPEGPALIVGNEFLDCLPVRQFAKSPEGWRERRIGLAPDGDGFRFGLGGVTALPDGARVDANATEFEFASGLETFVAQIAELFQRADGRALMFDYGQATATPGDTLRAFREGEQVDPLEKPGACDITTDVDFGRLQRLAESYGLGCHGPVAQGEFLDRLGAARRFQRLATDNPSMSSALLEAHHRLTHPSEMGTRFQAICLTPPSSPAPPGFEASPDTKAPAP